MKVTLKSDIFSPSGHTLCSGEVCTYNPILSAVLHPRVSNLWLPVLDNQIKFKRNSKRRRISETAIYSSRTFQTR